MSSRPSNPSGAALANYFRRVYPASMKAARRRAGVTQSPSWTFLASLAIALAALTATGLIGGHIVYSEGVGIEKANPKPDASHP